MTHQRVSGWVRVGVWTLPVYGLLTLWATFTHQPDPTTDFEAYARYVTTDTYLAQHLVGSIFGTVLAILGAIALGAYLVAGRAWRLARPAIVTSVSGHALIMAIFGMSTFATPAIGRAYLAGQQGINDVNEDILGIPLVITALAGGLLYCVGTILFGLAAWRSGTLPSWAGILYAPTGFLIAIVGLVIGEAQTLGSALIIVGGGWIAWSVLRRPAELDDVQAQS
jgi:hypothetical protein